MRHSCRDAEGWESWLTQSFPRVHPQANGVDMDPQDERRGSGDFATETDPVRMGAILEQHLQVPGGRPFQVVRCQPKFTRGGTRGACSSTTSRCATRTGESGVNQSAGSRMVRSELERHGRD